MSGVGPDVRNCLDADIARLDVGEVDAVFFERENGNFDLRPIGSKLFLFFRVPCLNYLWWKIGFLVKIGTSEVEDEWGRDNLHLDDLQFVVIAHEFRNIEKIGHLDDLVLLQADVDVPFTGVGVLVA